MYVCVFVFVFVGGCVRTLELQFNEDIYGYVLIYWNISLIWSFLVRSDLGFMTSHRVTFLYPNSWTVKLFLPLDNANKTELSRNRVQIQFQDGNVTFQF